MYFFPKLYYLQGNRLVMWFVFDIFNKELIVVVMDFHHSVTNWLKTEKEKKDITTMALIYISALLFDKWGTNRNMSHVIKVQSSSMRRRNMKVSNFLSEGNVSLWGYIHACNMSLRHAKMWHFLGKKSLTLEHNIHTYLVCS